MMMEENNQEENKYNREPVHYCKHCLSLKVIRLLDYDDTCYCDECGSTDIDTANIYAWELMYEARYGKKFLNRK